MLLRLSFSLERLVFPVQGKGLGFIVGANVGK